jgi:transcription elongation factor SPT6
LQAVGPVVWNNCASFLYLPVQDDNPESDFLDNTRIHPEDYEIARKISADALGIDEEDIQDEVATGGPSAVVQRLAHSEDCDKELYALALEKYAENLYIKMGQRKRRTLENIREEILDPYIELRRPFMPAQHDEIFTMLTGETKYTLADGMIIPVKIRRVFADHIEVRLDCGVDGGISSSEYPNGVGGDRGGEDPRQVYSQGQTVQAKLLFLSRKNFTAQLSLREENLRIPYKKKDDENIADWDEDQEASDRRNAQKEKEIKAGRAQRVIKHPLFRPFNSTQAEEFLGSQNPGDLVIRPSSRGIDHLAVTWKVADNVFQHIDVLELDKENEFAVGKVLKIANKYTYSDLDDLIVNHVKAMARKVSEMVNDERYQKGSREATGKHHSYHKHDDYTNAFL